PCACTLAVRVRWSRFLLAALQKRSAAGAGWVDATPFDRARLVDDGTGWTLLTADAPGVYVLRGSLSGLLR
ncbi:MAG: hypothetical protein QOH89_300, partial [Pseudonocardiales bacterium]|nr:hypothetical protein [Pseudonocardiales bacterium]